MLATFNYTLFNFIREILSSVWVWVSVSSVATHRPTDPEGHNEKQKIGMTQRSRLLRFFKNQHIAAPACRKNSLLKTFFDDTGI